MNKKGVLFTIDFIIALSLFVLISGSLYALYHNDVISYSNTRDLDKLNAGLDIIINNVAVGKNSCNLVNSKNDLIKRVAFCWDKSIAFNINDIDLNGLNYTIRCLPNNDNCLNISPDVSLPNFNTDLYKLYVAKKINIWVVDKSINKEEYLTCMDKDKSNNCDIKKEVIVYVWK